METARSELVFGPTLGSGNAVQRLPSKCSPSVCSMVPSPVGGRNEPTVQASVLEAAATAARLWSSVPIDALGTTVHPEPPRSTMVPFVPRPAGDTVSVPSGGVTNGGGTGGTSFAPVIWKRGVMALAVQPLSRHPRRKVCWSEASSEKWLYDAVSVRPRGPWLVMTTVVIVSDGWSPSSQARTMALLPVFHEADEMILLTTLPMNRSPWATSQLSATSPGLPESTQYGGAPCMSSHSSPTM